MTITPRNLFLRKINSEAKDWKNSWLKSNLGEYKSRCEGAVQALFYLAQELGFKTNKRYAQTSDFLRDKRNNTLARSK